MKGRDAELAAVLDGLRHGVGAVVVGAAGLGKSALISDVHHQLISKGQDSRLVLCSGRSDFPLHGVVDDPGRVGVRVIVVDDAHLLDADSAQLLWSASLDGSTMIVAALRTRVRVPDPVARLWTGGSCERLDLAPLSEGDIREVLEVVLGGGVEDRLTRLLTYRSDGNPLLLRELVRSGLQSGAIELRQHVWRLAGALATGAGAADVIRANLSDLDPAELDAARLLAVGEPLRVQVAELLIDQHVMESLEDKQVAALIEGVDSVDGPMLTLSHPLYAEVLRSDIAAVRSRRLRRELVTAFARTPIPSPRDALRSIVWRLDVGDTPSIEELLAAARAARPASPATAERLARAALKRGTSIQAVLVLTEILIIQGRIAEADALLDDLEADSPLTDAEHDAVKYSRAIGRTRAGELNTVIEMITGTSVGPTQNSQHLQAIYGQALMLDARVGQATLVLQALLADPTADPATQTMAACSIAAGSAFTGRATDCERVLQDWLPAAEAARSQLPFGPGTMMVATSIALAGTGQIDKAEALGHRMYDRALAEDDEWLRPRGASGLGVAALLRGQARTATHYFRIAVASLNPLDGQYLRYNLSYLARGAALAGYLQEARQALRPDSEATDFPIFRADWLIAQAAVLAAEDHYDAAAERALVAARHSASLGLWATVGLAAHDATRYTSAPEAVELLAAAVERVDGPLHAVLGEHAAARAAHEPRALLAASLRFEQLGALLYAAEAAYTAARFHRAAGEGRAAAVAAIRAHTLHAECENAVITWATGFQTGEPLTRREHHIALLAAAGQPDAQIATGLQISIRTVQNHLSRTYRKLAITGRHDLSTALLPHQSSSTD